MLDYDLETLDTGSLSYSTRAGATGTTRTQFLVTNQQQMGLLVVRRELSTRSVEHLTGKPGSLASVVLQIIPLLSLASRAPKEVVSWTGKLQQAFQTMMAMTHIRILGGRSSKLMQTWLVVGTHMDVAAEQSAFKTKVFTPTRRSAGHFALFASRSVKAIPSPWCLAATARASRHGECLRTSTEAKGGSGVDAVRKYTHDHHSFDSATRKSKNM